MLHRSNYYFNLYLKAQCVIFFRFLNQTKQENIRSAGLWELLSGNETQQSTISLQSYFKSYALLIYLSPGG